MSKITPKELPEEIYRRFYQLPFDPDLASHKIKIICASPDCKKLVKLGNPYALCKSCYHEMIMESERYYRAQYCQDCGRYNSYSHYCSSLCIEEYEMLDDPGLCHIIMKRRNERQSDRRKRRREKKEKEKQKRIQTALKVYRYKQDRLRKQYWIKYCMRQNIPREIQLITYKFMYKKMINFSLFHVLHYFL